MHRISSALALLALSAAPALAHTGGGITSSFMAGLLHPLSGLDHMAAMFAVGAWSALAGGTRVWFWPAAFVAAMVAGAMAGAAGLALPLVEPLIAATVVASGILVLLAARLPLSLGVALVAVFAVFHGHAHGTEAPATGFALYLTGFALATALLHGAGIAFVRMAERLVGVMPVRMSGAVIAVAGAVLLLK